LDVTINIILFLFIILFDSNFDGHLNE
jgi:hypothetical protein